MRWDDDLLEVLCTYCTYVRTYGCSLRSPSAGDRDSESEQRAGEKSIRFDTQAATRDTDQRMQIPRSLFPGPLEAALLW